MTQTRFTYKRCKVDDLMSRQSMIQDLAGAHTLPELNMVAQQYRELESQQRAMCALLMDGAEPVGFLLARRAGSEQADTAVLDVALAPQEFRADWSHVLGALTLAEAQSMAKEMGATGLRIPERTSGPASAAVSGVAATATGTAFYEAFQ